MPAAAPTTVPTHTTLPITAPVAAPVTPPGRRQPGRCPGGPEGPCARGCCRSRSPLPRPRRCRHPERSFPRRPRPSPADGPRCRASHEAGPITPARTADMPSPCGERGTDRCRIAAADRRAQGVQRVPDDVPHIGRDGVQGSLDAGGHQRPAARTTRGLARSRSGWRSPEIVGCQSRRLGRPTPARLGGRTKPKTDLRVEAGQRTDSADHRAVWRYLPARRRWRAATDHPPQPPAWPVPNVRSRKRAHR